jgi:hypothetical protein
MRAALEETNSSSKTGIEENGDPQNISPSKKRKKTKNMCF